MWRQPGVRNSIIGNESLLWLCRRKEVCGCLSGKGTWQVCCGMRAPGMGNGREGGPAIPLFQGHVPYLRPAVPTDTKCKRGSHVSKEVLLLPRKQWDPACAVYLRLNSWVNHSHGSRSVPFRSS